LQRGYFIFYLQAKTVLKKLLKRAKKLAKLFKAFKALF